MWNSRRELDSSVPERRDSSAAPPNAVRQSEVAAGQSQRSVPAGSARDSGNAALIGPELSIVGEVRTEQDLNIAGKVQGPIYCADSTVCVLGNGHVRGDVYAREVILFGDIEGDVVAKTRLVVRQDARLIGNVSCAAIMIEETAYFKGSIDIVRPRPTETEAAKPANGAAAARTAAH
jgi:cytoskeletal protein CcmA (bactofilin family)